MLMISDRNYYPLPDAGGEHDAINGIPTTNTNNQRNTNTCSDSSVSGRSKVKGGHLSLSLERDRRVKGE